MARRTQNISPLPELSEWTIPDNGRTSPKNIIIQDIMNSENSMITTESTNTNILKMELTD